MAWDDREADFYADCIGRSDYARTVGSLLETAGFRNLASVIDIGAGDGTLSIPALHQGGTLTAIEPQPAMGRRLSSRCAGRVRLGLLEARWQQVLGTLPRHEAVFAANIPGLTASSDRLYDAARPRWRTVMAWVVPAQKGPRSFCLAGLLPQHLHGGDETPGVALTLTSLGRQRAPDSVTTVPWTFRAIFQNHDDARAHVRRRMGLTPGDPRIRDVDEALEGRLRTLADGRVEALVPKVSAVLIWRGSRDRNEPERSEKKE